MTSFEQDDSGVTAQIRHRDSGETATVRALHDRRRWRAQPRSGAPGNPHAGARRFSNSITIYFRANVGPLLRGRSLSVIYVINPVLRGFLRIEKPFESGFLAVIALGDPEHPNTGCFDRPHEAALPRVDARRAWG